MHLFSLPLRIAFLVVACVQLSACTTSIFTGDRKNDYISHETAQIKPECIGMNLSEDALSVPATRQLVACMNGNHELESLNAFVQSTSDSDLAQLLSVANEEILTNKKRSKEIEITLKQAQDSGLWDKLFLQLNVLTKNKKLVSSLSKILDKTLDDEGLKALEVLAKDLNADGKMRDRLSTGLEFAERLAGSRSYQAMASAFSSPIISNRYTFESIAGQLHDYMTSRNESEFYTGKFLMWGIADGSLLTAVDHFLNKNVENGIVVSADEQIESFHQVVKFLNVDEREDTFKKLTALFSTLDDSIECMDATKEIPNAAMYLMNRFATWNALDVPDREIPAELLKLKIAGSFCNIPKGFNDLIEVTKKLSEPYSNSAIDLKKEPVVTSAEFLKALEVADQFGDNYGRVKEAQADLSGAFIGYKNGQNGKRYYKYPKNERYRRFLIQVLGDKTPARSYVTLTDLIDESSRENKKIVSNILYFANLINLDKNLLGSELKSSRAVLEDIFYSLMKPREELSGKSVYDALIVKISKIDRETFIEFMSGLRDLNDDPQQSEVFSNFRTLLKMNESSAVSDLVLALFKDASHKKELVKSLVAVLRNDNWPYLSELFFKMNQKGTLQELTNSLLSFMNGSLNKGLRLNSLSIEPAKPLESKYDKSAFDGITYSRKSRVVTKEARPNACHVLDYDRDLFDAKSSYWGQQISVAAACLNVNNEYSDVTNFILFAADAGHSVKDGKSLLALSIDLMKDILPSGDMERKAYDELSDFLFSMRFSDDMKVVSKFMHELFEQKIVASALSLTTLFKEKEIKSIDTIFKTFASILFDKDKVNVDTKVRSELGSIYRAYENGTYAPVIGSNPVVPYMNNLGPAVTPAMIDQYLHSVKQVDDERFLKNSDDLKERLTSLMIRMDRNDGAELRGLLQFFMKMNSNPYTAEWLQGWISRMSANVRAIPYYAKGTVPGKDQPKMLLVNDMDLLELIATDADFTLRELEQNFGWVFENTRANFAVKYFAKLALSKNLDEFIEDVFKDINGYVRLSGSAIAKNITQVELRRRLLNLQVTLKVLNEMNLRKDASTSLTDLDVLRDLFMAGLSATPKKEWHHYDKTENSLGAIVELAQIGLFRNFGPLIWQADANGKPYSLDTVPVLKVLASLGVKHRNGEVQFSEKTFQSLKLLLKPDNRETTMKLLDAYLKLSRDEVDHIKAAFYPFMQIAGKNSEAVVELLASLLSNGAMPIITQRADALFSFVKDERVIKVIEAVSKSGKDEILFKAVDEFLYDDAKGVKAGLQIAGALIDDPYDRFGQLEDVIKKADSNKSFSSAELEFNRNFEDRFVKWATDRETKDVLPEYSIAFLARNLDNGNFTSLVAYSSTESLNNQLYDRIRFLGDERYFSDLEHFIDSVRRGVQDIFAPSTERYPVVDRPFRSQ